MHCLIRIIGRSAPPRLVSLLVLIVPCVLTSCRHVSHVANRSAESEPLSRERFETICFREGKAPAEQHSPTIDHSRYGSAGASPSQGQPSRKSALVSSVGQESVVGSSSVVSRSKLADVSGERIHLLSDSGDEKRPETASDSLSPESDSELSNEHLTDSVSERPLPGADAAADGEIDHPVMDPLTLDNLVAMALTYNPSVGQAAATAQKAVGIRRQMGLRPNPTIAYMGQEMGDNGTAGMQGAFISQMIVLGDKLWWNRCVADREVQTLLWQVESQRYRVRNDVRQQFYQTLGAQQRLHLAEELERIAEDGVKNATTLQKANQAALPDVLQAQVQLREVEIIRQNTAFDYQASWDVLAALVGLPGLHQVPLDDVLQAEQAPRDRETAWAQILALSPQLQRAQASVERARTQLEREKVQPIPNLQLDVGVMHMNVSNDNAASVMLGIPVPIFNANEGNIDRAAAEYHRASWNVQRLELALKAELARAFSTYQQAQNRAATYREQILPAETKTLNLIETAYPLQFNFLRLLTARRSYFEARMEYLNALVDLRTAEVALDGLLLSGGLNDVPDTALDDSLRSRAFNGR